MKGSDRGELAGRGAARGRCDARMRVRCQQVSVSTQMLVASRCDRSPGHSQSGYRALTHSLKGGEVPSLTWEPRDRGVSVASPTQLRRCGQFVVTDTEQTERRRTN